MLGMLYDKNKAAGIAGNVGPARKEEDSGPDYEAAKEELAADIINAIDEKNPGKLAKAISGFLLMCDQD